MNKTKGLFFSLIFAFHVLIIGYAFGDTYQIDPVHSLLGFSVKHMTVSTVKGDFKEYSGMITFDPNDLTTFSVQTEIKAASISTNNAQRDTHLRSADFLDVEKHPTITFNDVKLTKTGDGYVMTGDLTIKGITKSISIPANIEGPVKTPMGTWVIGISGETTINRQDFGVQWNKTLDNGGLALSDEVKLLVNIEAAKK